METITQILQNNADLPEEKLQQILQNDLHRETLLKLIKEDNPQSQIVIKVMKIDKNSEIEIDKDQIQQILNSFGNLKDIHKKTNNTFQITFNSPLEAFIAQKGFDNLEIKELGIKFVIHRSLKKKLSNCQYSPKKWDLESPSVKIKNYENYPAFQNSANKLTCRYDVKIENDKNFQVAKKIIGSGGCNMKKIIECSINTNYGKNQRDQLKLRLRGIGSGYKEGPQNKESAEPLHLCVSAKNQQVYQRACKAVENLLQKIYDDYLSYLRKINSRKLKDTNYLEIIKFKRKDYSNNQFNQK